MKTKNIKNRDFEDLTDTRPYALIPLGEQQQPPTRAKTTISQYNLVGNLFAYESGELDSVATDELFQFLFDTGLWRHLQGSYGRELHARGLI